MYFELSVKKLICMCISIVKYNTELQEALHATKKTVQIHSPKIRMPLSKMLINQESRQTSI